ncbi:putative PEP-binding protein [Hyalangium versicolor]|uniref:putative PEP-binding protein n=1 Tax=Hyalangium versicolor TaxID=2861190 RepID=UPI001CCE9330|nr:putative PEP-binding protein [Hyalangium versicolor]
MIDSATIRPGEVAYLDATRGLLAYPVSEDQRREFEVALEQWEGDVRLRAKRARLPAVSRSGVEVQVLAQILYKEDVLVALDSGADGVGEIKAELLVDTESKSGSAAELVHTIRTKTPWKEIPIRLFDFDREKPDPTRGRSLHDGPMGVRGVRLLEMEESLMGRFLDLLEGVECEGIVIVLPMVTRPIEVVRFRERLMRRRLSVGVLVETPAAAVNIEKFLSVSRYFEIGVNDLTQFTMAWDRAVAHPDLLPVDRLADPVEQLVTRVATSVARVGGFASLAVDLAPSAELAQQVIRTGVSAIAVPPRSIPLWKERIRLAG